jgi:hypothetical protein
MIVGHDRLALLDHREGTALKKVNLKLLAGAVQSHLQRFELWIHQVAFVAGLGMVLDYMDLISYAYSCLLRVEVRGPIAY